jgi:hypothetical protein
MVELRNALKAHDASKEALRRLEAVARAQAEGLSAATALQAEKAEALKQADGLAKLGEISGSDTVTPQAEHDAAVREVRACTAACQLLIPRIEKAQAEVAAAAARVRGVAATEAAALLPRYIDEAHALAPRFAEIVAMVFELDAVARGSTELAAGENAAPIGAPLYNVLASFGIGMRAGWSGTQYVGPTNGRPVTLTPARLLELAEQQ